MSVQERNLAVIARFNEAMNRQDVDAAVACFAEDTRNHGRPVGRAGVTLVLRDILATFPDSTMTTEDIVAAGDDVIMRGMVSGTHLGVGPLPVNGGLLVGVPPTGRRYTVQHIHWFTLRDGLIIEHRANRDDVGMMVQLGLVPAPPPFPGPPPA